MTVNFDPKYIEVLLPITVPFGAYCWNDKLDTPNGCMCQYLDFSWGTSLCKHGFRPVVKDNGILKDERCMQL